MLTLSGAETVRYIQGDLENSMHTRSASAIDLIEMKRDMDFVYERIDHDSVVKVHMALVDPQASDAQIRQAVIAFDDRLCPMGDQLQIQIVSGNDISELVIVSGVRMRLEHIWERVQNRNLNHIFGVAAYDRLPLTCYSRPQGVKMTEDQELACMVSVVDADWPLLDAEHDLNHL